MVRCSPSPEDLCYRAPIVLTDRDRRLLQAVYSHGLLDMATIELAFFPPDKLGRSSASSAAYARTRQLWLWGYLDRIELPVAPRLGGRRPYLHALGWRGVSSVATADGNGTRIVQRRRLDRLDDLFIDHDLKAARFWANLVDLLRDTRVRNWGWRSERDIRAEKRRVFDDANQKLLRVLPDAEFGIRYPGGRVQWGMLEVDMGTHTLQRFRQKMRALDLYAFAQKDGQAKNAGAVFEVYVLTHSNGRLQQLRQATCREVGHGEGAYFHFATFDLLDPDRVREQCWQQTNERRYCLLYPAAFEHQPAWTSAAQGEVSPVEDHATSQRGCEGEEEAS